MLHGACTPTSRSARPRRHWGPKEQASDLRKACVHAQRQWWRGQSHGPMWSHQAYPLQIGASEAIILKF